MTWQNIQNVKPKQFKCGYCGCDVGSDRGYYASIATGGYPLVTHQVYICPMCDNPTNFDNNSHQIPGVAFGSQVNHVEQKVNTLYEEARRASSSNCYTGAVLLCRKLLMNIAVAKGAQAGKPFVDYIDFLAQKGFVPPDGRGWVDHIRKKGNEATHKIVEMKREDAEDLIHFSEMLLKLIYEFPARIPKSPAVPAAK